MSGGYGNKALYVSDTVGGGQGNTANSTDNFPGAATVGGGEGNQAIGNHPTVGGGYRNGALNSYATVPGGANNTAGGEYSFAAGQQAQAQNQGAFVWADSQNAAFSSTANDQFLIRAQGGVGIGTASPGELLEVSGANASIRVRNQNDPVGGFMGDTYYAMQLGMYNPTQTTQGVLSAGEKRSFFGFDYQTGQVGSLRSHYGPPTFRNVLDDGSGNLTTTGTINGSSDRNLKENFQAIAPGRF